MKYSAAYFWLAATFYLGAQTGSPGQSQAADQRLQQAHQELETILDRPKAIRAAERDLKEAERAARRKAPDAEEKIATAEREIEALVPPAESPGDGEAEFLRERLNAVEAEVKALEHPPAAVLPATLPPPNLPPESAKAVSMSLGVPTLWTVEEAHYLLSRMNAGNAGLATRTPTAADLDPNSINASQLQTIRQALSGDVAFSQGAGVRNNIALENYRADTARKHTLEALRDRYIARELELENQIATLQANLASMTSAGASADALKQQQAAVDTRNTELKQVTDLITNTDDQISKLNTAPPSFDSPGLPAQPTTGLPATAFDQLVTKLADTGSMFKDPKLQAAAALDNYIQMQYQIISRQLTLLRDDAGREDRVVFLEVPTGIYAARGWWNGDGKAVQVRWEATEWARACNPERLTVGGVREEAIAAHKADPKKPLEYPDFLHSFTTIPPAACANPAPKDDSWAWEPAYSRASQRLRVRTIELVPQQSAINIDKFIGKSNSSAFSAVFSWLSGLGAQARYQRQHDLAERYITAETHTSGFGKGSNVFGWNFAPLPTEKRLAAGIRTTYAAVAVPKDAVAVKLHGVACYEDDTDKPPKPVASQFTLPHLSKSDGKRCVERTEVVYIPSLRDMHPNLYSLGYSTTPVGQRITVTLHGSRLSPQIGVLVNGVELQKEVAIAQHSSANPAAAPAEVNGVSGSFEYVNSEFMILSFSVRDATRQPVITLVGPGFTQNLNYAELEYYVPGEDPSARRKCDQRKLFSPVLTVSGVSAAAVDASNGILSLRLDGTGLRNQPVTFQNSGGEPGMKECSADAFCRLSWHFADLKTAAILTSQKWTFSVGETKPDGFPIPVEVSFDNPLLIRFDQSAPPKLSWNLKADGSVDSLHVELSGSNLDPSLTYRMSGVDGNYVFTDPPAFATGKIVFDVPPPDPKVRSIRLSVVKSGTPLSAVTDALKLPARPAPKADDGGGAAPNRSANGGNGGHP